MRGALFWVAEVLGLDDEHGRLSCAEPIHVGELGVARGRRRGEPAGLVQRSQNRSVCAVAAGLAEACGPLHRRVRLALPPQTFNGVPACDTGRAVGHTGDSRATHRGGSRMDRRKKRQG